MSAIVESLSVAVVAFGLICWLTVVFLSPSTPSRQQANRLPIATFRRRLVARAWLWAPIWGALVLTFSALASSSAGLVLASADHCLSHVTNAHTHHLCLAHPYHASTTVWPWVFVLSILSILAIRVAIVGWRLRVDGRVGTSLAGLSTTMADAPDVRVIDQVEPLALTIGWRRPAIVISQGLIDSVRPETLGVVIAHERAHVALRHNRAGLWDRLMASVYPRVVAEPLLASLVLAREQAADAAAAKVAGGPLAVSQALTEVARLRMPGPQLASAHGVGCGALEVRIHSLLKPPASTSRWLILPVTVVAGLVLLGAGPLLPLVEDLLTYLAH